MLRVHVLIVGKKIIIIISYISYEKNEKPMKSLNILRNTVFFMYTFIYKLDDV